MKLKDLSKLKDIDRDDILDMLGLETKSSMGGWVAGTLATFGVGMLVGAGVALMLTPKSGRELREDLRDRLRRMPDDVNSAVEGMGMARGESLPSTSPKSY